MDIMHANLQKKYIQLGIKLLRRKLGESASVEGVKSDLENCGNPVFARIYKTMIETSSEIKGNWQRKTVEEIGGLLLWILYRDTAYKDIAIYILNEVLKDADKYKEDLKPYLKEPKDFYVNEWVESKELTAKKEGIGQYGRSFAEEVFTPTIQRKKWKKLR